MANVATPLPGAALGSSGLRCAFDSGNLTIVSFFRSVGAYMELLMDSDVLRAWDADPLFVGAPPLGLILDEHTRYVLVASVGSCL